MRNPLRPAMEAAEDAVQATMSSTHKRSFYRNFTTPKDGSPSHAGSRTEILCSPRTYRSHEFPEIYPSPRTALLPSKMASGLTARPDPGMFRPSWNLSNDNSTARASAFTRRPRHRLSNVALKGRNLKMVLFWKKISSPENLLKSSGYPRFICEAVREMNGSLSRKKCLCLRLPHLCPCP